MAVYLPNQIAEAQAAVIFERPVMSSHSSPVARYRSLTFCEYRAKVSLADPPTSTHCATIYLCLMTAILNPNPNPNLLILPVRQEKGNVRNARNSVDAASGAV
ncbi:hypothetical protein FVEG_04997 [Fusarium verticillioides 7600]|uniref:Uncharacterized protein n=1 Tax=Gibberella moniliformis (strain M3125 / FGSC 7600) TaxID=334819 RepID=W7LY93_GIBM7|nr:hypothetical protein FVEG_04997 [Fusarium verticillioides 7600]EWG43581.1 hypothetical protein FVEG_04997 [Fusarium verticillioides 7600]